MAELKQELIQRAVAAHQTIRPCSHKNELDDCFSMMNGKLVFWFNTEDESTHVVMEDVA